MKKLRNVVMMLVFAVAVLVGFSNKEAKAYTSFDAPRDAYQIDATTDSVTLEWSTVEGAKQYQVLYNDTPVAVVDSARAVITGLDSGKKYTFHVKVYDETADYCSSKYVYGTTLAPAVDKSSFGVESAYININVFYFAVADTSSYDVSGYQWQFLNASGKVIKTFDGKNPRIENFVEGTFYQYRVRSYVECGTNKIYGEWSACKTIGVPKSLSYKNTKSSITISFPKVNGATGYTVYISKNQDAGYKKVKTLSAGKRTLTIKKCGAAKLKKGTTYYVKIVPKAKIKGKTVNAESSAYYSCYTRSY